MIRPDARPCWQIYQKVRKERVLSHLLDQTHTCRVHFLPYFELACQSTEDCVWSLHVRTNKQAEVERWTTV